MSVIVRFAPSPTGYIHIGNLRCALLNWLFARSQKGQFMFRIDDTDQTRSLPEYVDGLYKDMEWIGLDWDIFAKQSDRMDRYQQAMQRLIDMGRLYPCYETAEELDRKRKIQMKMGKPPVYDRASLTASFDQIQQWKNEGRRPYWRFKLNDQAASWTDLIKGDITIQTTSSLSDPVLVKEDGTFLYTLSSVVDDIEFGITHIIRGEDHVTNTGVQIQLFEALTGKSNWVNFAHFSLLLDHQGQPLSKRINSFALRNLRQSGFDAMAVNCFTAGLGASYSPVLSYDLMDLVHQFDLNAIRGGARVDMAALEDIQAKLLHIKPFERAESSFHDYGVHFSKEEWNVIRKDLSCIKDMSVWDRILHDNSLDSSDSSDVTNEDRKFLQEALSCFPLDSILTDATWDQWISNIKQMTQKKGRALFHPIRLALTGRDCGPEMKALFPLIGRDKVLNRLKEASTIC